MRDRAYEIGQLVRVDETEEVGHSAPRSALRLLTTALADSFILPTHSDSAFVKQNRFPKVKIFEVFLNQNL